MKTAAVKTELTHFPCLIVPSVETNKHLQETQIPIQILKEILYLKIGVGLSMLEDTPWNANSAREVSHNAISVTSP